MLKSRETTTSCPSRVISDPFAVAGKTLCPRPTINSVRPLVPPKKSTLLQRHEYNYVTVYLGDSRVARAVPGIAPFMWEHYDGEVRLFYKAKPFTEQNDDATITYRNITVELLKGRTMDQRRSDAINSRSKASREAAFPSSGSRR